MTDFLRGTGVALATPMNSDYSIDFDSLERLTKHCIAGGVEYLVVMGTTGESPAMTKEEQMQILNVVKEVNNNQLPIIFGHGGNNTMGLVEGLDSINKMDIQGILSVCPYYNRPNQAGLYKHFSLIADASKHPIILYNVPKRTSSNLEAATCLELAKHDKIVAMKEASGDMEQIQAIIDGKPDGFAVLSGDDNLGHEMIQRGAIGVISVISNLLPDLYTSMVREALNGSGSEANNGLAEHYHLLSEEGNPTSLKAALKLKGVINGDTLRPPLVAATQGLVSKWAAIL